MDSELAWPPQMVEKSSNVDVPKVESNSAPKLGLSRRKRLRPSEFKKPITDKAYTRHLLALYHKDCAQLKLGVSISKRKVPLSVRRNQLKRLIKESFRHHQFNLPCAHIIIVATKSTNQATKDEINQCLNELWKKIK